MITAIIGIRLSYPLAAWWAKLTNPLSAADKQLNRTKAELLD
jgi:hypothetical protein